MPFVQTNINYATQYARELANAYPYLSYFGEVYGAENARRYRPIMGKTVAVPSLTVSGARSVNRNQITGQFSRNFNNEWQTLTMSMDREWDTIIDPMDIVETNDVATIANITRTFNESQKIPEMDAYAAYKLAAAAQDAGNTDTTVLTADNILTQWDTYLAALADARISRDRVVCKMIPSVYKLLKEAAGLTRFITADGKRIDRNVGSLDGVRITEIPADLMKTKYDFASGWAAAADAAQINMLFIDPLAVVAPVVYDTSMMSPPSAGTKGKYVYYERYYYDVFVLDRRSSGVLANITSGAAAASETDAQTNAE